MALEPLVTPLRTPQGGWPRAARRVELIGDLTLDQAVFALAERARLEHIAQVAQFEGADLWAYPHQSVAEIAKGFRRMRLMTGAGLTRALKPDRVRWLPEAKLAVVLAVRFLAVDRDDISAVYGVAPDELADWEQRYDRFGLAGLKAGQIQALRLSPPSKDALAAAHVTSDVAQEKARG